MRRRRRKHRFAKLFDYPGGKSAALDKPAEAGFGMFKRVIP